MSGLVGVVSEVYQGDSVRGPARNKIERQINLPKEILESEILVAQPPPNKTHNCPIKRPRTKNQKGGSKTKKTTKRSAPKKQSIVKRKKKNV